MFDFIFKLTKSVINFVEYQILTGELYRQVIIFDDLNFVVIKKLLFLDLTCYFLIEENISIFNVNNLR